MLVRMLLWPWQSKFGNQSSMHQFENYRTTHNSKLPAKENGPGIFAGAIALVTRCVERVSASPKGGIAI
jgi:hypothetical protein